MTFIKGLRQQIFFFETLSRMLAVILGPSLGQLLYNYYNKNFAIASTRLSFINFFFIILFFFIFVLPLYLKKSINKILLYFKKKL